MADRNVGRSGGRPRDELGDELRRISEGIVRDTPPEDLVQRALAKARTAVAAASESRPRVRARRRSRRAMFWSTVAAVSVGAAVLAWFHRPIPPLPIDQPTIAALPQTPQTIPQDLPTAWAYRQALAESPEAMEALLDHHAKQTLRPEPQSFQVSAFPYLSQPML